MTEFEPVYPRKYALYIHIVAMAPLVELFASLSPSVTYITLGYRILVMVAAAIVCADYPGIVKIGARVLLVPALYVLFFTITSYYGVNLQYSIDYRLQLLPLLLVDFFSWFLLGLIYNEGLVQRRVFLYATAYSVLSIGLGLSGLIDVDLNRVISGPDLPVAAVASMVSGQSIFTAILFIASVASLKKTVVLCTLGGIVLTFALMRFAAKRQDESRLSFTGFLRFSAVVGVIVPFLVVALPYVNKTLTRFVVEREDTVRTAMTDEFFYLLGQYFPEGIGYYTFGYLTEYTLNYYTYDADGREVLGLSLHNTFMHVLLEGGLAVSICFLIIFGTALTYAFRLFRDVNTRNVAILMIGWVAVSFMFGMTNQLHATRYYFGIAGFCYGCYYRYRKVKVEPALEPYYRLGVLR